MIPAAIRGRLLLGTELIPGAVLLGPGGHIEDIVRGDATKLPEPVWEAHIVAPGFIDLQVNGGFGVNLGGGPLALRTLAARLPATGVTAFLPTLVSSPPDLYARAFAAFREADIVCGARPLGFHLEGPFLSPRRPGAHLRDLIEDARIELIDEFFQQSSYVRLITVAPERSDILAHIVKLCAAKIPVSLGHTDATYEEFEAGVDAGATMATHLFNAMAPFSHREPGVVGAALLDDRVTVGLIADGIHVHPASVALTLRCKGYDRVALVTDMVAAAGMPDGEYTLGVRRVIRRGGAVRLEDGTLAGSVLTMDQAVRNVVRWGVPIAQALHMASVVPARMLGIADQGQIRVGGATEFVLLDADLRVQATIGDGQILYQRPE